MENDSQVAQGTDLAVTQPQIAPLNETFETQADQRARELEFAFEFSQEIVADLDLNHLLQSVTERARAISHAQSASLCLLDEDRKTITLAARSGDDMGCPALEHRVEQGLTQNVIGAGQTTATEVSCSGCSFYTPETPGICAAAPLRAGKTILGALCVIREPGEQFDSNATRALTLLANSAAIAIANARLAEAGRRQAEHAATLAERERLAGELHDNLAQTLSFLNLKTDRAREMLDQAHPAEAEKEIAEMKPAIDLAYRQVRAALVGLREPISNNGTAQAFAQQLARCLDEFQQTTGIPADLSIADSSALTLSPVALTQALFVAREALTNVRRHARARQVQVLVQVADDKARLIVQDDGIGFEPQAVNGAHHLGLAIMLARAERSGGSLTVESTPGRGTRVTACFPLSGAHT